MVLRRTDADGSSAQQDNALPYPVTPTSADAPQQPEHTSASQKHTTERDDVYSGLAQLDPEEDGNDSSSDWDKSEDGIEDDETYPKNTEDIPPPLKIQRSHQDLQANSENMAEPTRLPSVLKPGRHANVDGLNNSTPVKSSVDNLHIETLSVQGQPGSSSGAWNSNNPFLPRTQTLGTESSKYDSPVNATWESAPNSAIDPPKPIASGLKQESISGQMASGYQDVIPPRPAETPRPPEPPIVSVTDSQSKETTVPQLLDNSPLSTQPPLIPVETEEPEPQNNFSQPHESQLPPPPAYQDVEPNPPLPPRNPPLPPRRQTEEEPPPLPYRRTGLAEEQSPALPARSADNQRNPYPTPPPERLAGRTQAGSSRTQTRSQKSEVYQIKHIRWRDEKSGLRELRQSPIMIQNANGPCPLLALVNALVLTTPPFEDTPLVEALRTREQVSIGLLLDAVFDELMSGRRGDAAQGLPDVGELYTFLITLHTGMNVNPRFVPHSRTVPTSFAGGFEDTKEMKLYSTFAMPLIHGWLPRPSETASQAFQKTAQTYEDAQNILFREEELESNLQAGQLSNEQTAMLMDITTIKEFLSKWSTQLTPYGLDCIRDSLRPGEIAILFRNDHFSTLYHEPRSGILMTLVTDAGYSSHDEIVWESLVDINGAECEHFSGDFKSVTHGATEAALQESSAWNAGGAIPVQNQTSQFVSGEEVYAAPPGPPPGHTRSASEQEDHDLALALQLQEEEEAQHRSEQEARRRHEEQLSQEFLNAESARTGRRPPGSGPPQIPQRRSGQAQDTTTTTATTTNTNTASTTSSGNVPVTTTAANNSRNNNTNRPSRRQAGRAPVNRPVDESDWDPEHGAPPSYDEAASAKPFHPPNGHPSSENLSAASRYNSNQRPSAQSTSSQGGVGYAQTSPAYGSSRPPGGGRQGYHPSSRPGQTQTAQGRKQNSSAADDRHESCLVM